MRIPARGLKNIRTLAGRADTHALPYRRFMQITCLEMEKARRNAERSSAAARIHDIDTRLNEIEEEKQTLLEGLAPGPAKEAALSKGVSNRKANAGFRIRY